MIKMAINRYLLVLSAYTIALVFTMVSGIAFASRQWIQNNPYLYGPEDVEYSWPERRAHVSRIWSSEPFQYSARLGLYQQLPLQRPCWSGHPLRRMPPPLISPLGWSGCGSLPTGPKPDPYGVGDDGGYLPPWDEGHGPFLGYLQPYMGPSTPPAPSPGGHPTDGGQSGRGGQLSPPPVPGSGSGGLRNPFPATGSSSGRLRTPLPAAGRGRPVRGSSGHLSPPPVPSGRSRIPPPTSGDRVRNLPPVPGDHRRNRPPAPGGHLNNNNPPPLPGDHLRIPGDHLINPSTIPGDHLINSPPVPDDLIYMPPLPGDLLRNPPPAHVGHLKNPSSHGGGL